MFHCMFPLAVYMRPAIHENLRKKVQAVSMQYDQDKKMLIVLVSSGRPCVRVEG